MPQISNQMYGNNYTCEGLLQNESKFCITISQFLLDQVDVIAVKVRIAKDLNLSFSNNP